MDKTLFMILVAALYFFPCIVADYTRARNKGLIWVLNIFFGWSIIGWIVPLFLCFAWRQDQVAVKQADGTVRMQRAGKHTETAEEKAEVQKQLEDFWNCDPDDASIFRKKK